MGLAEPIEKRHKKQCEICFLLDVEAKNVSFHLFDEGFYNEPGKYVCAECLKDLKTIKKKCYQNWNKDIKEVFKSFEMSFVRELPKIEHKS